MLYTMPLLLKTCYFTFVVVQPDFYKKKARIACFRICLNCGRRIYTVLRNEARPRYGNRSSAGKFLGNGRTKLYVT